MGMTRRAAPPSVRGAGPGLRRSEGPAKGVAARLPTRPPARFRPGCPPTPQDLVHGGHEHGHRAVAALAVGALHGGEQGVLGREAVDHREIRAREGAYEAVEHRPCLRGARALHKGAHDGRLVAGELPVQDRGRPGREVRGRLDDVDDDAARGDGGVFSHGGPPSEKR